MNFNDRLADLRRKKGLSQERLGYELGVSRQTVPKWELGRSEMRATSISAWSLGRRFASTCVTSSTSLNASSRLRDAVST